MVGIMEQVDGFDLPFSTGDTETPKMRLVGFADLRAFLKYAWTGKVCKYMIRETYTQVT